MGLVNKQCPPQDGLPLFLCGQVRGGAGLGLPFQNLVIPVNTVFIKNMGNPGGKLIETDTGVVSIQIALKGHKFGPI